MPTKQTARLTDAPAPSISKFAILSGIKNFGDAIFEFSFFKVIPFFSLDEPTSVKHQPALTNEFVVSLEIIHCSACVTMLMNVATTHICSLILNIIITSYDDNANH
jgi:hypothetical protein